MNMAWKPNRINPGFHNPIVQAPSVSSGEACRSANNAAMAVRPMAMAKGEGIHFSKARAYAVNKRFSMPTNLANDRRLIRNESRTPSPLEYGLGSGQRASGAPSPETLSAA